MCSWKKGSLVPLISGPGQLPAPSVGENVQPRVSLSMPLEKLPYLEVAQISHHHKISTPQGHSGGRRGSSDSRDQPPPLTSLPEPELV